MKHCKLYNHHCRIELCSAKLPGGAIGRPFLPCIYLEQEMAKKAGCKIPLRAQLDRWGRWKIEKKVNDKWLRFGGAWYWTRSDTQDAINNLVLRFPDEYTREEQ